MGLQAILHTSLERAAQSVKQDASYQLDGSITPKDLLSIGAVRVASRLRGLRWQLFLRQHGGGLFVGRHGPIRHPNHLSVGSGITLSNHVSIDALSRGGVVLGNNVSVGAFAIIKVTGSIANLGVGVRVGKDSNIGDYCYIGAAGGVVIGDNVLMGQRVSFHSENHCFDRTDIPIKQQGTSRKGIVVEDDCWIGSGAIILDGVTLGQGVVVGAGSVVTADVPAYSIVAGVPAKVVKQRKQSTGEPRS